MHCIVKSCDEALSASSTPRALGSMNLSCYYGELAPLILDNAAAYQRSWVARGRNVLLSAILPYSDDTLQVSVDIADYVHIAGLQAPILNEINVVLASYNSAETDAEIARSSGAALPSTEVSVPEAARR